MPSEDDPSDWLLTEDQAAEILGLRPSTLAKWRMDDRRRLPFFRIGGSIRYKPSDIRAYIAQQRRPAAK